MQNRFQVLEGEVRDDPCVILIGDSLIRHQDEEFCVKGPRRKNFCYPGKKLIVNSSEENVFVYQVGTNNVVKGRSEVVYDKYKAMIRKIKDSCRRSVVCGLIPSTRYDVGPLVLNRMLGINTRLEKLYSKEDVMYVDVWDHFINDRSLFSGDGFHLDRVGKARLGRVLDEGVKYELIRNKAKLPKRGTQPVQVVVR